MEADAILHTEFEARARKEYEMPPNIPYPNVINMELVQIAHLYTKNFVMINRCLDVCGLNRQTVNRDNIVVISSEKKMFSNHIFNFYTKDLLQFDGPLFYVTLEKLTKLQAVELQEFRSKINWIRIYENEQDEG